MSIRIGSIEDLRVQSLNVEFDDKSSVKIRLAEHPKVDDFVQGLDHQAICFKTANCSELVVQPEDINRIYISYIVRFVFYDINNGWQPSKTKNPQRRLRVFKIEDAKIGSEHLINKISKDLHLPHP